MIGQSFLGQGTDVNRTLPSLHGGSIEVTLTVFLREKRPLETAIK